MKTETEGGIIRFSPRNPYKLRFFVGHANGGHEYPWKDGRKRPPQIFHACPLIKDFLTNPIPSGNNPRSHPKECTRSPIAKDIAETLNERPEKFGLVNRGATIIAESCDVSPDGFMEIILTNPDIHGAADGATTITVAEKVIRKLTEKPLPEISEEELPEQLKVARIQLKIVSGVSDKELIAEIVEAHNTSRQVKDFSLADFRGEFDWLKNHVLETNPIFAGKIGYDENAREPVKILNVLAQLYCFHPHNDKIINGEEQAPVAAYAGKSKLVPILENEALRSGFTNLLPIVADILLLNEYIHEHFQAAYDKAFGDAKLGKRLGVESFRNSPPEDKPTLPFTGKPLSYEISNALLYPLLSGFRAIVAYRKNGSNPHAYWKMNPFQFFDKYGADLVRVLIQQIDNHKTPNAAAKKTLPYIALYKEVQLAYARELDQVAA